MTDQTETLPGGKEVPSDNPGEIVMEFSGGVRTVENEDELPEGVVAEGQSEPDLSEEKPYHAAVVGEPEPDRELTENEKAERDAAAMRAVMAKVPRDAPPEVDSDVLDLTSMISTRKLVKLPTKGHPEGEPMEMRLLDDFGIVEQQEMLTWTRRFEELWNRYEEGVDLTNDERVAIEYLLDKMVGRIIVIPPDSGAKHSDFSATIKARVLNAFTYAPTLMRTAAEARLLAKAEEIAKGNPSETSTLPK